MTTFQWGLASDVGQVRSVNQDNALAFNGFFAVADGMGGHRGGEVASEIAVDMLQSLLPVVTIGDVFEAIHDANHAILRRAAAEPDLRGMGTTVCVLALIDDDGEARLAVANVGDSRVYQFADGVLQQMTEDHSMVAELVRQGRITAAEAEAHPQRNIVTRALGVDEEVAVDAWKIVPFAGDRWLLCSDGLFNEVDEDRIASVLNSVGDPNAAAGELVRLANESGGRDNVTVLVVDIVDAEEHAASPVVHVAAGASDPINTAHRSVARPAVTEAPVTSGEASAMDSAVAAAVAVEDPEADSGRADAAVPLPLPISQPATDAVVSPAKARRSFGATVVQSWRVALFVVAVVVLVAVAVGAWIAYGDDEDGPPIPATTTIPTSTAAPSSISPSAVQSGPTVSGSGGPVTTLASGTTPRGATGSTNAGGDSGPASP